MISLVTYPTRTLGSLGSKHPSDITLPSDIFHSQPTMLGGE